MLILPIKKKWFDLIKSGEKTTEYREFTQYWKIRFNLFKWHSFMCEPIQIMIRNGYRKDSPSLMLLVNRIEVVSGIVEDYLDANKTYFAIRIKEVL